MLFRMCNVQSLEPTFKAWRVYAVQRKQHRRDVMTRMLARLEQAGAWVRASSIYLVLPPPCSTCKTLVSMLQRAFRQWKLFSEHESVNAMRTGLEGQKAYLAGEVSKLKASGPFGCQYSDL